jgi:ACS family tartrate transporter-like MFS transporter
VRRFGDPHDMVYMRLLPFAILSYFLAYIDRINVSFAALTMRRHFGEILP